LHNGKNRRTGRQALSTATISIVLAVALFAVASMFEGESRRESTPGRMPEMNPVRDSRLRGPVRTIDDSAGCERTENELQSNVEQSRYCNTDDDCTIFDFGYPIQCLTSVAKSDVTALRLAYRQYEASCKFRVYYDCPSGESERRAVCRSNRCEVELMTLDGLKEATLEHLGIDR